MAKTQATTKPTAASETPSEVKQTKMERAAVIYDEIIKLSDDQLGGKTPRRLFMDRCVAELQMGEKGANTYFQNLKNEKEGKGRYAYAPASQAASSQPASQGGDPILEALAKLGTQVSTLNRTVKRLEKASSAHA